MTQNNSIQNQNIFVMDQNISAEEVKNLNIFYVLERKTPLFLLTSKPN